MPRDVLPNILVSSVSPLRALTDPTRRWTHIVGQLRHRASKLAHESVTPSPHDLLVDDLVATCTSLLQELAGLDLQVQSGRAEAQHERERADSLFERMPVACVSTDDVGRILAANQAAGRLLNMSSRHVKDRLLLHFAQDRSAFNTVLRQLPAHADGVKTTLTVRPRERAATLVHVTVVPASADGTPRWLWFFAATDSSIGSTADQVPTDINSRRVPSGTTSYSSGSSHGTS